MTPPSAQSRGRSLEVDGREPSHGRGALEGIRWVEPHRGGRRGSLELRGRNGGEGLGPCMEARANVVLKPVLPHIGPWPQSPRWREGVGPWNRPSWELAGDWGEGWPPARRGLTGRSHAWRRSGQMPVWLWVGSPRSGSREFPPRWPSPCRSHGYCGRRHCRRAGGARGPFWCSGLPGGWGFRRPQAPALLGPGKARRWRV